MFAAYMANDLQPDFNQHDIPRCRKHITLSIIKHAEIENEIEKLCLRLHQAMLDEAKSTLLKSGLGEVMVSQVISFLRLPRCSH